MHVDRGKGLRSIGVHELHPTSFNAVAVGVRVIRHLGVPLEETPRGKVHRSSKFGDVGVGAKVRIGLAVIESLRVYFLDVRIINHGDGVSGPPIFVTMDVPGQGDAKFREVRDVLHLRLTREVDQEGICPAVILDPLLSVGRPRHTQD